MIIISTSLSVPGQPSPRFHVKAWLPSRSREMDYYRPWLTCVIIHVVIVIAFVIVIDVTARDLIVVIRLSASASVSFSISFIRCVSLLLS